MRLIDLADQYALRMHLSELTLRLHKLAVREFSRTLVKHAEIADFTDENVARHVSRRVRLGKAPATIYGEQCKLLALWRFACRLGYLTQWPNTPPVKVPAKIPRAWTKGELALVFKALEHARPVGSLDGRLWWRALFLVLWDSAARISEALAIEWANVDLDGRTIYVPAEVRKGQVGDRLYPIADDTADALNEIPRSHTRPFFFPFGKDTLYNRLKRMLVLAGLPADRQSKFHRMRRSTASHYEANGGNATELLGHTSRKVTRVYLDPRICKPDSAISRLFRPEP